MTSPHVRFAIAATARSLFRVAALATVAGWGGVACGGIASERPSIDAGITEGDAGAGSDGQADAHPTTDAAPGLPPGDHRPTGSSCAPSPVPPEPRISDAGLPPGATFDCQVHADCTARPRGRCVSVAASPPEERGGTRCEYECLGDGDCPDRAACACGSTVSVCLEGNCRVDDDCGPGGFCSPSLDSCGNGPTGYFCHTNDDTCRVDGDCDPSSQDKCVFDRFDTKRWACTRVGCL